MNKTFIFATIGAVGAALTQALGGWDSAIQTLVIFMIIDFLSGWSVAAIAKNSKKTESGGLRSSVGLLGIAKKIMILGLVVIAQRLDIVLDINVVRTGAVIAFCGNEALSIIENAGLLGVPIPDSIKNAIDALAKK